MKKVQVILIAAGIVSSLLFLACSKPAGEAQNEDISIQGVPAVQLPTVALADGAEIYKTNCAECHGLAGEGSKKGIPLISGHALHHTSDEYVAQVNDGHETKMPAFRDKLSTDEIAAVVKYVRTTVQAGIPRGSEHHEH